MKDYKTINKIPDINKYPIEKMDISVKGKILYMISSESHNTFILTEEGYFYVISKGKIKDIQGFELKSEFLDDEKLKLNNLKLKSDRRNSQIWCNKFGTHVIIKYKSIPFYYNPMMKNKIAELKLVEMGTNLIEPFSVAFNDDFYDIEDTGIVLISDYDSAIYETQIKLDENKEDALILRLGNLYQFKKEVIEGKDEDDEYSDFYFFKMDQNDRILDMKIMISSNPNMGVSKDDYEEEKNIFILAITKNTLFQFHGKNSFNEVFENYKNEKVLKSYKKFISDSKGDFRYSRIQLLNEEQSNKVIFGFMTQCGYISGKFESGINPKPQKNFSVTEYYKPTIKKEEKKDPKHHIAKPIPKTVCQSKNHIFFLYHDFLVIQNKLTKRIIHYQYLPIPFLDMYYNQILNGIIIYNDKGVYKIPLENEFRYLFENYIEIGEFKTALDLITKEDKIFRPKLHKIYADYLFDKKQFMEAAEQYAFSDEIFEHVCMKFLYTDNNLALIKYLSLIINLRIKYKSIKNILSEKDKKEIDDKNYIEKYLINTWILELLFWKNDITNIGDFYEKFKIFIRQVNNYLDFNLLYYIINIYGREKELLALSSQNSDYEYIILHLINQKKVEQALELIKLFFEYGDINLLKQLFFKYSNVFMKDYPSEAIELLAEYFKTSSNPADIIRMLTSPNFYELSKNEDSYKILVKYVRDLSTKPIRNGNEEMNLTKNQNLHNLYVLILSLSKNDIFKGELIDYIKRPIESYEINQRFQQNLNISSSIYYDLYFAKKIFENKKEETDIKVLCIILFLLKQYSESLDLAINNNFQKLSRFLLNNIPEPNLKKKIWIQIFDYIKKTDSLSEAKKLIKESQGIITVEDILPLIGDDAKISEFKEELKVCIANYELSVQKLNKEIKDFNDSNDLINKDIDLSERKAIKMNYTSLRCYRCKKNISGEKFFMFPCRHIFDAECLIETYKEFNKHNLGDQDFKNKIIVIKELRKKIRELNEKKQKSMEDEPKTKELENLGALKKMKTINIKNLLTKTNKIEFTDEEESTLKGTQNLLYNYLDGECLLCGKEMINSIQVDFGDEIDDELNWDLY